MKQLPQRTCVGCMQKKDKKDLIRIVKNKQNEILVDKTGKAEGRGIYICNSQECLEKAIKTKKIDKTFEMQISEEIYNDLRGVILGK